MQTNRLILLFIMVTILVTVALQVRWNLRNYEQNKHRLRNEIQIAFDTGVENYYAGQAKTDFMIFATDSMLPGKMPLPFQAKSDTSAFITFKRSEDGKSTMRLLKIDSGEHHRRDLSVKIVQGENIPEIRSFANRVLASMLRDSVDFETLDKAFAAELKRKQIEIAYGFEYAGADVPKLKFIKDRHIALTESTKSKSTYLPPGSTLTLQFSDPVQQAFSRSFTEIILSLLLSLTIIGCLLFLLRIINRQKRVEEIRNDLISNITHEFKTPITTIGSAIEGIRNFNEIDDKIKTNRYLEISQNQLGKLSVMVEKLLETAALNAGSVELNKERTDIVALLKNIVEKHQIGATKEIRFVADVNSLFTSVDAFHIENVISNLIDNAQKYGGDQIVIRLSIGANIEVEVEDNGIFIEESHRERIFEQFYRIPKGNLHEVKGFGIGLYYSRKIIEKHNGKIELVKDADKTTFKITLPYG